MTDLELLSKVKTGLGITGNFNDPNLLGKVLAAKQVMSNAGITDTQIATDLGIATITVGVSDLLNLSPGEVKFSDAFLLILVPQLQAISRLEGEA